MEEIQISPQDISNKISNIEKKLLNKVQSYENTSQFLDLLRQLVQKFQTFNVELNSLLISSTQTFISGQEETEKNIADFKSLKKHIFYLVLRYLQDCLLIIEEDISNFDSNDSTQYLLKAIQHLNEIDDIDILRKKLFVFLRSSTGLEGRFLELFLSKEKYNNYSKHNLSHLFLRYMNMYSNRTKSERNLKTFISELINFELFSKEEQKEMKKLVSFSDLPYDTIYGIRLYLILHLNSEKSQKKYFGDNGQIQFVDSLISTLNLKSLNLGQFFTVLPDNIKSSQNWSKINLPYEVAVDILNLLNSEDLSSYFGDNGQIRFVDFLINTLNLKSLNLGSFYSVLPDNIKSSQSWSKIDLPYEVAVDILNLLNSEDLSSYFGDNGQIRFVGSLISTLNLKNLNLNQFYGVLPDNIRSSQDWSVINLPYEVAVLILNYLQNFNDFQKYEGNDGQIRFIEEMLETLNLSSIGAKSFLSIVDKDLKKCLKWNYLDEIVQNPN